MYLTLCPNSAFDKILFIDEWVPGTPMRTDRIVNSVGGKGLNSAVILSQLGLETVAISFFAGRTGQELVEMIKEYGITVDAIWAGGTNRIAHVIADKKKNVHSHVIAGNMDISSSQKEKFIDSFKKHIKNAEFVIFGGSIPQSLNQDFYTELIPIAKANDVPTLVDAQKQVMVESIKSSPDIVKMNWDEFRWTFNQKSENLDDLLNEAIKLYKDRELKNLIITMGRDGILAITKEGIYFSKAPLQNPINAAGAGDAVSSTIAYRMTKGDSWPSVLHWATAVGAAAVLTERTGEVDLQDVERIMPDVSVEKLIDCV